jgi:hypothetical protein
VNGGKELSWTRTHAFKSKISNYRSIHSVSENIMFSLRLFATAISFDDTGVTDRRTITRKWNSVGLRVL